MFALNGSSFSAIVRAGLIVLVSSMCVEVIIASPRGSHLGAGRKSGVTEAIDFPSGFGPVQNSEMFRATGRVIDAVTAQPIAGAHFVYGRPANSTDNGGFLSFAIAQANGQGEFRLEHLKLGHYALYIASSLDRSDLYSDVVYFDVVDADVNNLEIQARHGSKLNGFIVPAGVTSAESLMKLSSVKVVAAVPSIGNLRVGIANVTSIGRDGSFQFTGLRPGKAYINLKADNESLNGLSILRIERNGGELKQGIEIKPGEDIFDFRVIIADGPGVIRGQIKITGGDLPSGARMVASISNQLRFANGYAPVDEDGRFAISGLAAGTYEITLNTYSPPPRQTARLLPTLRQTVKVTGANESQVVFTVSVPTKD